MSDRTRNEKGQYNTGQETPESEKAIPPPPETTGQTQAQNEKGPHQTTQSTAQIGVLHTETTGQTPAQSTAQIGVLHMFGYQYLYHAGLYGETIYTHLPVLIGPSGTVTSALKLI